MSIDEWTCYNSKCNPLLAIQLMFGAYLIYDFSGSWSTVSRVHLNLEHQSEAARNVVSLEPSYLMDGCFSWRNSNRRLVTGFWTSTSLRLRWVEAASCSFKLLFHFLRTASVTTGSWEDCCDWECRRVKPIGLVKEEQLLIDSEFSTRSGTISTSSSTMEILESCKNREFVKVFDSLVICAFFAFAQHLVHLRFH